MSYCKRNASELSANFYHIVVLAAIADVVVLVAVVAAVVAELDGLSQVLVGVTEPCALFVVVVVVVIVVVAVAEMARLNSSCRRGE